MLLSELVKEMESINGKIKQVLKDLKFDYDYWPEESVEDLGCDKNDPDALQLISEYRNMLMKLSQVSQNIEYLKRPIVYEGILHMNEHGRFEFDGIELTCGMGVEILVQDYPEDSPEWVASSIEANNGYYFVARPNLKLEGKRARIRKW